MCFGTKTLEQQKQMLVEGLYKERKRIMKTLYKKTGVKYFRFHALCHFGAPILGPVNFPLGSIQRVFGFETRSEKSC